MDEIGNADMTFRVSGKNMDIGEALRARIGGRVEQALTKYFDGTASGHVTVERDGAGFRTDCVVHLSSGATMQAEGLAHEAYESADAAARAVEKRLRRYKRRLKDHRGGRSGAQETPAPYAVIRAPTDEDVAAEAGGYEPVIVAEAVTSLRELSVGDAVLDLDLSGAPVVVFRHAAHGRVNVVYRRRDGNIGWIDPPGGVAA
jgi:ribosomal subunit interface protein